MDDCPRAAAVAKAPKHSQISHPESACLHTCLPEERSLLPAPERCREQQVLKIAIYCSSMVRIGLEKSSQKMGVSQLT
jgi:hypothetical protein